MTPTLSKVGETLTFDGVGVVLRGDLVLIDYGADARLERTRWVFDRVDELAATRSEGGFLCLMIVAETAGAPNSETRAENASRLKKLGPQLRRLVTVPLGDAFHIGIVRTIMRALIILTRQNERQALAKTEAEGIAMILASASPATPSKEQVVTDLQRLHERLRADRIGHA